MLIVIHSKLFEMILANESKRLKKCVQEHLWTSVDGTKGITNKQNILSVSVQD